MEVPLPLQRSPSCGIVSSRRVCLRIKPFLGFLPNGTAQVNLLRCSSVNLNFFFSVVLARIDCNVGLISSSGTNFLDVGVHRVLCVLVFFFFEMMIYF